MVKTGQVWTGNFTTEDATGALATPSVGPAGVLYVAGVATADVVTISGANPYKFSVTLPALTAGQSVAMYITATIATIAKGAFVAQDVGDLNRISDLVTTGTGAIAKTLTFNDGASPLDGAEVWITTDAGGTNVVASGATDAFGQVTFYLDAGTYYVWQQLSGFNPGYVGTTVVV